MVLAVLAPGCSLPCGPSQATVERVIDGDTIVLSSGEHVRYALVDSPETTNGHADCFGVEATRFNADRVAGKTVELIYDDKCVDRYGRLLAYVWVDGLHVNAELIRRGYACVRYAAPDHDEHYAEFKALQANAKAHHRGLWSTCRPLPPAC